MVLLDRLVPVAGDVIHERYELLEELGRGGFGVVYRARQRWLDEDVALKLLLPHVVTNPQAYHRFEREIAVAKKLRHPNSIHILDCGQTEEGLPFYVMEYVTGKPLDEVLIREHRLSEARTQHIAIQVLKSLGEAHEHGVVHRDLKPGNIMLCQIFGEQDFVKVLDFGIAKALAEPDDKVHRTETGAVLGTPAYMSHEQALGERELDGRSDLYSVGLIMAECLTGQPVVHGETPFLLLAQHAVERPLRFPEVLQASPLWPVIEQATQKQRELRFGSAIDMRHALEALTDLSTTPISADSTVDPLPPSPYSPGATPPELSTDQHIWSGQSYSESAPTVSDSQTLDAPKKRGGRTSYLLVAVSLLLVGVFAGAWWIRSMLDAAQPSLRESPSTAVATRPAKVSVPPSESGLTSGGTDLLVPPSDASVAPAAETSGSVLAEPAVLTATATAMVVAADRLQHAVPDTHRVRFEGTSRVRVLLEGELLGVTPFDGLFPLVDRTIELRFERDGYRSSTESVSMRDEVVRVVLHHRHDDRPGAPPAEPPAEPTPESAPPLPFGQTPIEDRSGSTPFRVTPVDEGASD